MAYEHAVIRKAMMMRRQGMSVPTIATTLDVAKSTAFHWVREVSLSDRAIKKLVQNSINGRKKGLARIDAARKLVEEQRIREAVQAVGKITRSLDRSWWQLIAALIFWCEGSKRSLSQGMRFTNSDPELVVVFLRALRNGFDLNEGKFRVLLHLHEYHNPKKLLQFWSTITAIPSFRFYAPYLKPHTSQRKREGYQGCVALRYADVNLSRKLRALYRTFAASWGLS